MNKKPLKKYTSPNYPRINESMEQPELLEKLPKRWSDHSKAAIIAGFSLISAVLTAEPDSSDTNHAPKEQTALHPDKNRKSDRNVNDSRKKNAIVAPLLEDALKNDGRGAFGCVVVNPPTFLSENEAMEIIITEFAKAGIKLKKNVTVKNISAPNPAKRRFYISDKKLPEDIIKTNFDFDLASKNGTLLIEYISRNDYDAWKKPNPKNSWSSVQGFDFAKKAKKAAKAFSTYQSSEQKVFGIFFDPLASIKVQWPNLSGIKDPKLRQEAIDEFRKSKLSNGELKKEKAEERLKAQIHHFIEYLKKNKIALKSDVNTKKKQ